MSELVSEELFSDPIAVVGASMDHKALGKVENSIQPRDSTLSVSGQAKKMQRDGVDTV